MIAKDMRGAWRRYNRTWRRVGWNPGSIRFGRFGFYVLPEWMDNVDTLAVHVWRRLAGQCLTCRMPARGNRSRAVHKMDCAGGWTVRDDLRRMRLWPRRAADRL